MANSTSGYQVAVSLAECITPLGLANFYEDLDRFEEKTIQKINEFLLGVYRTHTQLDLRERYEKCSILLIPINTGNHWTLGAVDRVKKQFLFFDTGFQADSITRKNQKVRKVERLMEFLTENLCKEDATNYRFVNFGEVIPQQRDIWSCGYHTLKYAQALLSSCERSGGKGISNIQIHGVSNYDMQEYREYLAGLAREWMESSSGAPNR